VQALKPTVRRSKTVVLTTIVLSLIGTLAPSADVIDRVLAVVGTRIVTLSDARAALVFGLSDVPAEGDRTYAAMQRLIERELLLTEVQRYLPQEPTPDAIDRRFATLRRRFASEADFEHALATTGLSATQLREHIRDDLRIANYLDDRFAASVQPTDEEVLTYARAHRAEIESLGGTSDAQIAAARGLLTAERRQARIDELVAGLRRRADVTELYLSRAPQ
jgi:hypothetical protein